MKWAFFLSAAEASLAFAKAHRSAIVALAVLLALVALLLLAVYLPSAHYRATPVAAGFLLSFFAGVAGCKALDRPEGS